MVAGHTVLRDPILKGAMIMATFTLSGRVTDATTNAGLPGALVMAISASGSNFGKSGTTDATGHYSIAGLAAGTLIVEAFLGGYTPVNRMLTIGADATQDFMLHPALFTLQGTVTDALTNAPVQDALVKIVSASGSNFGKSATTDATGSYKITGLTAGTIIVEASLAYVPNAQQVTITSNMGKNFALAK
jgi:uncharacterized surface anchored protein